LYKLTAICSNCYKSQSLDISKQRSHHCIRCSSAINLNPAQIPDPLTICPSCNYAYFYIEPNFPKSLGLIVIVLSIIIFITAQIISPSPWYVLIIATAFLLDTFAYKFLGLRTVCYNCLTEFRNFKINPEHKEYNLIIAARFTNTKK
jgi:hypothetical protein